MLLFLSIHLAWWLIYGVVHFGIKIKHDTKKLTLDTKNRIVSIIHACIVFVLSVYDVLSSNSDKCGDTNSEMENVIFTISSAYFLYDFLACLLLGISDFEMVFHHIFCIMGYWSSLAYNNSSKELIKAIIVTEITCPMMHLRIILKNFGLRHTKLYDLCDNLFYVQYMFARLVYGTMVTWFTVSCSNNLMFVKIGGAMIWLQSVLFSSKMFSILKSKLREYKERKAKNVELFWFRANKKVEELEYFKKKKENSAAL